MCQLEKLPRFRQGDARKGATNMGPESASGWVVVGYQMGACHARLIGEVQGLTLAGVCDIDPQRRRQAVQDHPGIRTYDDFAKVITDPSIDGVVIVTPHDAHAAMAIAAMKAGKNVITDKPLCLTVREADEMIAARDAAGVLLSTFQNRRWDGDFLTVRRVFEQGLLGRIHHIQSCVTYHGQISGWRTERARMGGWLYDWGAHTIDQIMLLVGANPLRVHAFAHHRVSRPSSVEDYVNCTITFEGGRTATTVIGYMNHLPMPRWYIMGEDGALQGDDFEAPLRIKGAIGGMQGTLQVPLDKTDWEAFYRNIAAVLAGREKLIVMPVDLRVRIAVIEAAYRSVETGEAVSIQV